MFAVLYSRPAAAVGHTRPLALQLHSSPDVADMLITAAQQCLFSPGQLVPVIDTTETSMAKSKGTYSSPFRRSMPHVTALQQQQQQQQPPLSGFLAQVAFTIMARCQRCGAQPRKRRRCRGCGRLIGPGCAAGCCRIDGGPAAGWCWCVDCPSPRRPPPAEPEPEPRRERSRSR